MFLISRNISNGGLTNRDWEVAANIYVPAISPGSKESFSGVASMGPVGIVSVTYVTTDEGQGELYLEAGGGMATPQIGASATDGQIFGEFESATDYEGKAGQIMAGITPDVEPYGITGEYWVADGIETTIWGVDAGVSAGWGIPTSLGWAITKATPFDVALKNLGLFNNPKEAKTVHNITYQNWDGPELLVCRVLSMCGR